MSLPADDAARLYGTLHHFFEVSVHLLLFHRGLYPPRAFAAATAFDLPVRQCRHPAVALWVRDAVDAVLDELVGGSASEPSLESTGDRVNTVALAVHAPTTTTTATTTTTTTSGSAVASCPPFPAAAAVLERWVFDVRHLPPRVPGGPAALRRAERADLAPLKQQPPSTMPIQTDPASPPRQPSPPTPKLRREQQTATDWDDDDGMDSDVDTDLDLDAPTLLDSQYDYYDEQDELAAAESEADLDDDDDDDDDGNDNDSNHDIAPAAQCAPVDTPDAPFWADLHLQLRAVVQRLGQTAASRPSLPTGSSFTLAMELGSVHDNGGGNSACRVLPSTWMPSHAQQQLELAQQSRTATTTTTVRAVDAAPVYLECWVEESVVLQELQKRRDNEETRKSKTATDSNDHSHDHGEATRSTTSPKPPSQPVSSSLASSYPLEDSFFGNVITPDQQTTVSR